MEKLKAERNLLTVSSRASVTSDSDDSGFAPSEEMVFPGTEDSRGKFKESHRRFSTICTTAEHFKELSIPEVVVTNHDDEEPPSSCSKQSLSEKRIKLRRSLSSPGGLVPNLFSSVEQNDFRNHDYIVTLEDVEKFKVMRKKSGGSGSSNFDERLNSDDCWSYTNFSSSQASESEVEREEFIPGEKKTKKCSSWKKIRPVMHMIPFVQMFKHKKYPWVQLAGHPGNFLKGIQQGTVLKKYNSGEVGCYQLLMEDPLRSVVPRYHGVTTIDGGQQYTEMQCCLDTFSSPNICDIKMGVRTFLEGETSVTKPRHDLYLKMVKEDQEAPTESEKAAEAITKYRYLDWRDRVSSTRTLGFRIEALTVDGKSCRNFKTKREPEEVKTVLKSLVTNELVRNQYIERLLEIQRLCAQSSFFPSHELIGSSLLFVNDNCKASVWMIDFEKTKKYEGEIKHNVQWEMNNHEDGYLLGLENIISLFENL